MSAAQDELDALFANQREKLTCHPEDALISSSDKSEPPSDNEDAHDSDNDNEDKSHPTVAPSKTSNWHLPTRAIFDANTGPKGVIADARAYEQARKHSFHKTMRSMSGNSLSSPQPFTKTKMESPNFHREKSASPEYQLDDDEQFLRSWRQNRINELQDPRVRRVSPSKRKYGSLEVVDAVGYLDAVEKVAAETVVVVCIYDDEVRIFPHFFCTLSQRIDEKLMVLVGYSRVSAAWSRIVSILLRASTKPRDSLNYTTLRLRWIEHACRRYWRIREENFLQI